MNSKASIGLVAPLAALALAAAAGFAAAGPLYPQLAAFSQRLATGERVTVAYFGGSITWGATASDPLKTSWRALVTAGLEARYPQARIRAVDAAIGGQPSQLGVFRMDRDVLPYKPDLCFVEFAVNDWEKPYSQETMEGIIRKLRACRADMAVVLVLIGSNAAYDRSPSQDRHIELAAHYGLPVIDIYSVVKKKLTEGLTTPEILTDTCHPNDAGYRLYADIVLAAFDELAAATGSAKPAPAAPLTANRYETATMIELAAQPGLGGWKPAQPAVVGTWFDQQPSRWLSSAVAPAADGAELALEVECSGLGLYYEATQNGGPILLAADGEPVLTLQTAQELPFSRVVYAFTLLDGPARRRRITLTAPQAGRTQASYLLVTK